MLNNTKIKLPKKYDGMIEEIEKDSDGYWAYSKAGFCFPEMECHTAHEDTQAQLLKVIRNVAPCNCDECEKEIAKAL